MSGEGAAGGVPAPDRRDPGTTTDELVEAALTQLRHRHDDRWVEVSGRVRERALRVTRGSQLLRVPGRPAGGQVLLAEQVVVAHLRAAVDDVVPDTALLQVRLRTTGRDTLEGVRLTVVSRYGASLLEVADAVRERATGCFRELFGPDLDPGVDVHVGDVTPGDPAASGPPA